MTSRNRIWLYMEQNSDLLNLQNLSQRKNSPTGIQIYPFHFMALVAYLCTCDYFLGKKTCHGYEQLKNMFEDNRCCSLEVVDVSGG